MRIMVTGNLGTIGMPLERELRAREHTVSGVDIQHTLLSGDSHMRADVSEYREIERALEHYRPEMVYHAAAEFGRVNGEHYYEQLFKTNMTGTANILGLQRRLGFKLVMFSSSEIYGEQRGTKLFESVADVRPLRPLNNYAITKWANELQCMNAIDDGAEIVRVRLFNTYGPGEFYSPYRSVVCQFVYHALVGMTSVVYKDYVRTSCYIDDTVRTLANIADNFVPGAVYNIAGDQAHTIGELWSVVAAMLPGSECTMAYEDGNNVIIKEGDTARARSELGHRASVPLEEGVRRTIEWQKEVYARRISHPSVKE